MSNDTSDLVTGVGGRIRVFLEKKESVAAFLGCLRGRWLGQTSPSIEPGTGSKRRA